MITTLILAAALTAPPTDDNPDHLRAIELYEAGKKAEAAAAWHAAWLGDPRPKYAFNVAGIACTGAKWTACWRWCATILNNPIARRSARYRSVRQWRRKALRRLKATHAFLALEVTPETDDLELRIDGDRSTRPRFHAVRAGPIELSVASNDRILTTLRWHHEAGKETTRRINLRRFVQRGADSSARTGRREVSSSFQVQGNPIKPDLPPRPDYRTWKWVTLGVGLALGGASAGLLAHSYGMTDDLNALNEQAAAGQLDEAEYGTRFDDTRATQVATWRAGVASAAVGGAALVAGVVLFILDAQAEPVVEADAEGLRAGMRLRF